MYRCPDCGYTAASLGAVKIHWRRTHLPVCTAEQRCPAPGCGFQPRSPAGLARHILARYRDEGHLPYAYMVSGGKESRFKKRICGRVAGLLSLDLEADPPGSRLLLTEEEVREQAERFLEKVKRRVEQLSRREALEYLREVKRTHQLYLTYHLIVVGEVNRLIEGGENP